MDRRKQTGIILIVIGVLLPLVLLLFVTGYQQGSGFINTLFTLKIQITVSDKYKFGIPYRLFVAFGVAMIFIGIRCFDLAKSYKKDNDVNKGQV